LPPRPSAPSIEPDDRSPLTPDVAPEALEPPAPDDPDLGKLAEAFEARLGADVRTVTLVGLLVLAVFYTLYFARSLFMPIVLAILLDFLLSPAVRALRKLRIPNAVGAGIVVFGVIGAVAFSGWWFSPSIASWIRQGPQTVAEVRDKLQDLRGPVAEVTAAAEQMEAATQLGDGAGETPTVQIEGPSLSEQLFGGTMNLLSAGITVVFLTFFLLAAGDLFLTKVIRMLPQFKDKRRAVEIAREIEAQISVFLITSTLIGLGVGAATAVAAALVGLPNAVLWGAVAFVLNYIPYLGNLVTMVLLGIAGFTTFHTPGEALVMPAIFFGINVLEGNFVTPLLMGRRLRLNTVAVFVGLVFWFYVWGIAGAIMAVPILATIKIVCDRVETLAPLGEFLGE
jgi:predicted PurR-regulated permease PerM